MFLVIVTSEIIYADFWNCIFFRILWWIESKKKKQDLFEIEIFCNIANVFTVTFDNFNASLLNKIIYSKNKTKKLTNPQFWMVVYIYYVILDDIFLFSSYLFICQFEEHGHCS